jgi:thymidylate synthase (FAD)
MAHHRVPAAEALLDQTFPVLDHGFVRLVDYMGSDAAIVEAARCSMAGENTKATSSDRGLVRYLMAQTHTSPFEMVELKFHCSMPIFVARQWIRHRTANVNEMSGRYSELPELTYVPAPERIAYQSPVNKQGSGAAVPEDIAKAFCSNLEDEAAILFESYHESLGGGQADVPTFTEEQYAEVQANGGISRELARINLPLSTYTQWYWKIDLHNLFHFLALRLDSHAQWEIQQYGKAMAKIVEAICPVAWEAFCDYRLNAIRLSGVECEAIGHLLDQFHAGQPCTLQGSSVRMKLSGRELAQLAEKLAAFGLGFINGNL